MGGPYRRSSQHGLMWVIIVLLGVASGIFAASGMPKTIQWWWFAIVIMSPMLVAIALCVWLERYLKRRRVSGIQASVERQGFIMDPRPGAERKQAVFAPVADLQRRLGLPNGSEGIQWVALHTSQPSSACIFEHSYITGSGKSTQEHSHTIVAWLAPGVTTPGVSAFRPHWLQRRMLSRGAAVVKLGDAAFDRQWVILGDEISAKQFLIGEMRAMLGQSPKGESWHFGNGWLACAFDGAMNARNLALFRLRCANIVNGCGLVAGT